MEKFLTYRRIAKVLKLVKNLGGYHYGSDDKILEIEIKELIDLGFISLANNNLILGDKTVCNITIEGEKFLNAYSGCRMIEYFFKDYSFLGALLIGFVGGVTVLIVKSIISSWCTL